VRARILDLAARIPPPDACKHIAHLRCAEPISLLKKKGSDSKLFDYGVSIT
jgi:hypothetical protein